MSSVERGSPYILTPPLPAELADMVIEHLKNDVDSLKNCSLVCKSWLSPSSGHLFKSLNARDSPYKRQEALSSTRICSHIREFETDVGPESSIESQVRVFIRDLPRLEFLALNCNGAGTHWIRQAIENLPPSPLSTKRTLQRLHIGQALADLVWYLLGLFDAVASLNLFFCASARCDFPRHSHSVKNLEIRIPGGLRSSRDPVFDFCTLPDPTQLETLKLECGHDCQYRVPFKMLNTLFEDICQHVKHFEYVHGSKRRHDSVISFPALKTCTRLESVAMTATPPESLCEILPILSFLPPQIKRVKLVLMDCLWEDGQDYTSEVPWSELCDALAHCVRLEVFELAAQRSRPALRFKPIPFAKHPAAQKAVFAKLPARLQKIVSFI